MTLKYFSRWKILTRLCFEIQPIHSGSRVNKYVFSFLEGLSQPLAVFSHWALQAILHIFNDKTCLYFLPLHTLPFSCYSLLVSGVSSGMHTWLAAPLDYVFVISTLHISKLLKTQKHNYANNAIKEYGPYRPKLNIYCIYTYTLSLCL